MSRSKGALFSLHLRELSGALGDLGTLLRLMLGAIAVAGLAPAPVVAIITLTVLFGLLFVSRCPAALIALMAAVIIAPAFGSSEIELTVDYTAGFMAPSWPSMAELERAFSLAVLPQFALTFTNAFVLTALIAHD